MASLFMGTLTVLMLGGGVLSPAISSAKNMGDINNSIDRAQSNYNDLESKWQDVFKKQGKLTTEMSDDIVNTFAQINANIDQANKSHAEFQDQNRTIQYIGIMMVFFIFFLLLLKQYDLFDTINDILLYPFRIFKKN